MNSTQQSNRKKKVYNFGINIDFECLAETKTRNSIRLTKLVEFFYQSITTKTLLRITVSDIKHE